MPRLLFITLILFITSSLNAQIIVSATEGCSGDIISFDYNTSSTLTNIQWLFDDGGTGSNNIQSQHQYNSSGTYHVSFDATDGANTIHEEITITIHPNPSCGFNHSSPITGCVPLTVSFTDASTGGGGTAITDWHWDFGDGGTVSGQQNPDYEYTIGGAFTINLQIEDANGCVNDCDFGQITVSEQPTAIIITDPNPAAACDPPLSVDFDASSSISTISSSPGLTYNWNLGIGNTSTNVTATETYTDYGNFSVSLTVTDAYGCSHDTTTLVRINSPTASFEVNDTVCHFVQFNNTSTPAGYLWDYGDGYISTTDTHTYVNTGWYTVTLIAYSAGCSDTAIHDIYVEEVIADFYASPDSLCDVFPPGNIIHYYNQSTSNAVYFEWELLEHDTVMYSGIDGSNLENPTDTITFLDTTYSNNGILPVSICLLATSVNGCHDKVCKTVYIKKPNALFMPDIVDGCAPLTVVFSDSSIALSDIIEYSWDFGDGNTSTGTDEVISHTYPNPGHYDVVLSITTDMGCQDTSYAITIDVGDHTNPDFDISPTSICPLDTVQFTNLTSATDSVDNWYFIADDGHMTSCYGNENPSWAFQWETGFVDLSMVTCNYGCCDTITKIGVLEVKGPICHMHNYKFECPNPYDYIFSANVESVENWQWDFGDGTVISGLTDLNDTIYSHHYDTTGDYTVIITAFNSSSGCAPFVDSVLIHVRNIHAEFYNFDACEYDTIFTVYPPDTIENGPMCYFNSSASQDVYINCGRGYYWNFGDDTQPLGVNVDSLYHSYYEPGIYDVSLVVTDINGCRDTAYAQAHVHEVFAGFEIDPPVGCSPSYTVNLIDTSIYDFNQTTWFWDFGDGTTDSVPNTSHEYIYTGMGSYSHTIKLVVTDSVGCVDSLMFVTHFSIPDTIFTFATDSNICVGDSVGFNTPNNIANYVWTFNGTDTVETTNSGIFYQTFPDSGHYQVHLFVTDINGCTGEYTFTDNDVSVQDYPIAGFYSEPDFNNNICYGEQIHFYDTSIVTNFYDRIWNLGDGLPIVPNDTVGKNYNIKGTYTISLIEITTNGCADTVSYDLEVVGPIADFDFNPDNICKGQFIDFSVFDMEDVYYLSFDYGDGIVDSLDVSGMLNIDLSHQYNYSPPAGYTTVQLRVYSDNFRCSMNYDSIVNIYPVIADFTINNPSFDIDTLHCIGPTDMFYNHSVNNDVWTWNFGDGNISVDENPIHYYDTEGTYDVILSIHHNTTGCEDTLIKTMYIKPLPDINAVGGDTCLGASIQIYANTYDNVINYIWSPSTGLSNDAIANPVASPSVSTTYTVIGSDQFGCSDTATAYVYIQQEPSNWIVDTTIIIGEDIIMEGDEGGSFTYVWSPDNYNICTDCPNPHVQPSDDIEYTLIVTDTMGCGFSAENIYTIHVLDLASIDVPDIFTPNGDGDNDVIYVKGWGIKELLEFSIYNRWGEKVFTTSDINVGWDGTYKGKKQNMDSYAYYVKAIVYIDQVPYEKKGTITLIR